MKTTNITALKSCSVIAFLIALVCPACEQAPAPTELALSDYIVGLAQKRCAAIVPCCRDLGSRANDDTCVARQMKQLTDIADRALAAGRKFVPANALRCMNAERYESCQLVPSASFSTEYAEWEACYRMFVGSVPQGAPCKDHYDCAEVPAGPARCDYAAHVCTTFGVAGSPCERIEKPCVSGAFCGVEQICHIEGRSGALCLDDSECATNVTLCVHGKCVPLPKRGEPCINQKCAPHDWCDIFTGCAERFKGSGAPGPAGTPCGNDRLCLSGLCLDGKCTAHGNDVIERFGCAE